MAREISERAARLVPRHMGGAHQKLVAAAQAAKTRLYASIDGGHRGIAERELQIEALLDYQEYLYAADIVAGYAEKG